MNDQDAKLIEAWAHATETECLFFKCSADDELSRQIAEANGYRLVDLPVLLRRDGGGVMSKRSRLRGATADDVPRLRQIASRAFLNSRFYSDPNFPSQRCDDLYALWVERSVVDWPDRVLVADVDGSPGGFISVTADQAGYSRFSLMAVASEHRRQGLGDALVVGAIAEVGTAGSGIVLTAQTDNWTALAFFARHGFEAVRRDAWYHRWTADLESTHPPASDTVAH